MRSILTPDDLADEEIDAILARARALRAGTRVRREEGGRLLALIFLEASLRTRVGFSAAAARLGWQSTVVAERRHSPVSMMESWADTLRTVAGYADAIVARPGQPLGPADSASAAPCPLLNGGDTGPKAHHPSQALIDLFAIDELVGPVAGLRIAVVGDPRMRAARSLLSLLARRLPSALLFVADPEHLQEIDLPPTLGARAEARSWAEIGEVDVVYVAGIPHQALPLARRDALLVTAERVAALPARCVLLSPMPVIDEMDDRARQDPRNRMFEQSDLGLYVRMALLEQMVAGASSAKVDCS